MGHTEAPRNIFRIGGTGRKNERCGRLLRTGSGGFHHTWVFFLDISCSLLPPSLQSSRYISDRELVLVTGAFALLFLPVAVHVMGGL